MKTTAFCLAMCVLLQGAIPGVASAGQLGQGIQVHGHWTIEVRDPDGSLVTRREFENALGNTGPDALAGFLSRATSPGGWAVLLAGATGPLSPCGTDSILANCVVVEPQHPSGNNPVYFKNLTVGRTADSKKLVLGGNATAQRNGNISTVSTHVQFCNGPGSTCLGSNSQLMIFTTHKLETSIDVKPGQQIQVTVEIGFSSPPPPTS